MPLMTVLTPTSGTLEQSKRHLQRGEEPIMSTVLQFTVLYLLFSVVLSRLFFELFCVAFCCCVQQQIQTLSWVGGGPWFFVTCPASFSSFCNSFFFNPRPSLKSATGVFYCITMFSWLVPHPFPPAVNHRTMFYSLGFTASMLCVKKTTTTATSNSVRSMYSFLLQRSPSIWWVNDLLSFNCH